ncbi:hypothetical protein VNI00_002151 [Paramarasmius palmivorus]|uniref:Exonuclease V n=1 Tax=Paramarasmius palmivorus TaxID=297713 RepID=A0AAW0E3Z5_9AGAR
MAYSSKVAEVDEYDQFDDFTGLSTADFATLDAQLLVPSANASPKVEIELEKPLEQFQVEIKEKNKTRRAPETRAAPVIKTDSPFKRFRKKSRFSVSDLVGPTWCEYQFDYGLRQKRHRKLEHRPASFVTKKGKEIVVQKEVAIKREVTLEKGKSVHKQLEQEIRPEKVVVDVTTQEETWALRLIDILACFDDLVHLGCAREMPVFGFVDNHPVLGVIDEVIRMPLGNRTEDLAKKRPPGSAPTTPQKPKRSKTEQSQHEITQFLERKSRTSSPTRKPELSGKERSRWTAKERKHVLHINDSKTRKHMSLPPHEDTLPSRLQLMVYYRFLDTIMSNFDFAAFWNRLGLDPWKRFSDTFISQAGVSSLLHPGAKAIECLDDFMSTGVWNDALLRVDASFIDPTLVLVYRSAKKKNERKLSSENSISAQEQADIARAIAASLNDCPSALNGPGPSSTGFTASFEAISDPTALDRPVSTGAGDAKRPDEDPDLLWAIQQSMLTHHQETKTSPSTEFVTDTPPISPAIPELGETTNEETHDSAIIGTKTFRYDAIFLDRHLRDVLDYWEGRREPRGVTIEESRRCSSCEYRNGCEWRDQKALEFAEDVERKRREKQTTRQAV